MSAAYRSFTGWRGAAIAAAEAALVAGIIWMGHALSLPLHPTPAGALIPAGTWLLFRLLAGDRLPDRGAAGRFLAVAAVAVLLWLGADARATGALTRVQGVTACYLWLALALFRAGRGRLGPGGAAEGSRLLAVLGGAGWLMHPFLTPALRGAGDAQWYATTLADVLAQTRHGIFPVFVGQSEYQFNGAVYPLRVAPAFHYFGAILDWATAHALEPVSVQNLLLFLVGLAGGVSAYACLAALHPSRRWLAAAAAFLYLACPGLLGLTYNSDLFMSWMTVPFLPLVLYGTVRSFETMDRPAGICLGAGLGLMWWGHSPIAGWTTGVVAIAQAIRLCRRHGLGREFGRSLGAGALFAAVAAYPLVSVLLATPESGKSITDFSFSGGSNDAVIGYIRQAYPGVLRPLHPLGILLPSLQLGYSLWMLWLAALLVTLRRSTRVLGALALASTALLLLVTPVFPGLTAALWHAVPSFLKNITGYWPMNRLYTVLSGTVVFFGWQAVNRLLQRRPGARWAAYPLAAAAVAWSASEVAKFHAGARLQSHPRESGRQAMLLENVGPSRFAYFNFPSFPDYFTHGVTDPALQSRLLAADGRRLIAGDVESLETGAAGKVVARGELKADPGEQPIYHYLPHVVLEPGRRYALLFDFKRPDAEGLLIVAGRDLWRLIGLPEFGGPKSFGSAPGHSRLLPLWTDDDLAEEVRFEFRTTGRSVDWDLSDFGGFRLLAYDPARLPVQVWSFLPYRANVRSPSAAWLETPRMYQDSYQARVDGRRVPVAKSAQGLVMLPVPAGISSVKLQYYPPPVLLGAFWLSFLAGAAALALAATALERELRGDFGVSRG